MTRGPLEDEQAARRKQTGRPLEHALNVSDVVRRIQQNQIEDAGGATAPRHEVAAGDSIAALQAAYVRVLLDEPRRTAVFLDKRRVRRPATERLEAECARACVRVEDARTRDARRQDVEERLPQLVGRRPDASPLRWLQPAALELACDHPQPELHRAR